MPTLVVEGWRFIPHSYALVNQHQLAALAGRTGLDLFHRDLPYYNPVWTPRPGTMPAESERRVRAIPPPPPDLVPDALLRIAVPYDFREARAGRTFIFGTAEFGAVMAAAVRDNQPLPRAIAGSSVHIITPSNWSREGFIRSGIPADRVHVVPHGIDPLLHRPPTPDERADARRSLHIAKDDFVFLNIGAMTQNKGLDHLFRAFASLVASHPRARLLLKGIDALYPSSQFLRQTAARIPPADMQAVMRRTHCLIEALSAEGVVRLYHAADAYACPYLAEGFNLPALEAAACGLPVICTAGGPTDDFTTPEFALRIASDRRPHPQSGGIMLVPRDQSLIECMRRVIDDDDWRTRAAVAGPEHTHSRFAWSAVADKLLQLLLLGAVGRGSTCH